MNSAKLRVFASEQKVAEKLESVDFNENRQKLNSIRIHFGNLRSLMNEFNIFNSNSLNIAVL